MHPTSVTASILFDVFAQWSRHAAFYGKVMYGAAFARHEDQWRTVVACLIPLRKGDLSEECRLDYRDLLIIRGMLSLDIAQNALKDVIEQQQLKLPALDPIAITAESQPTRIQRWGSQHRGYPLEYAGREYRFRISESANVPRGLVCAPGLPLYPHAYAAIEHALGVRVVNQSASDNELIAIAPDYRARVRRVFLSSSEAKIEIETAKDFEHEIVGKAFYEDSHGRGHHYDLEIRDGAAIIPMAPSPRNIIVVLLSRLGGEVIDEWFFNDTHGNNIGVEISLAEQDLENLITLGESETLEFKRKRPTPEELTLTICAFANTRGGRLLMGVTNSAEVIGCEETGIDDWITSCLRSHCDPTPRFSVISSEVRSKRVVVVEIPEGTDKPYTLRERGIYIRSGATSRSALRHEIERVLAQQRARGGLWS